MTTEEIWLYFGKNWGRVCNELEISRGTMRNWRIKNSIPFKQQMNIQRKTVGALRANLDDDKTEMHIPKGVDVNGFKNKNKKCNQS